MTQLRIDFQGRGEVQTFSRARVEAMCDGLQLTLRVPRQVRTLEQVLAQQLVGAALPRAVRIGKEDQDCESAGQPHVLGHLFPPIIGQGFSQWDRHVPEFLREAIAGTPCIRPRHPGQDNQASRPLHQDADGLAIASPLDQVAFPVAGYLATGGGGGRRKGSGQRESAPANGISSAEEKATLA